MNILREQNGAHQLVPHDPVQHPAHYRGRTLEAFDVMEDWGLGLYTGTALKYILRCHRKAAMRQDCEKALVYLRRAMNVSEMAVLVPLALARTPLYSAEFVAHEFDVPGGVEGDLASAIAQIRIAATCWRLDDAHRAIATAASYVSRWIDEDVIVLAAEPVMLPAPSIETQCVGGDGA